MKNTGERHIIDEVITDEAEFYNHLMHIATYQFAEKFIIGKRVLDYGCGSGYGSYSLSLLAEHVKAVDISHETIEFAKNKYKATNIEYCLVSELNDEKFDVITSFQVIEHVTNNKEYINKLKSLLKPNGYLLISTPDKRNRLFNIIQRPWNIYHLKEYSELSLKRLLLKQFNTVEILKIGSKSELVTKEISRDKIQRNITLPCTLIIYPNFIRIFLLKFQVKIYRLLKGFRKVNLSNNSMENSVKNDFEFKYTVSDIEFSNDLVLSTDLLAICKNE
ncbi:MAG: methyltransferase domain-containing protein [Paludibacter sp.]|nr:methyltransferase domain-containing protein [Paludibacter sp.]